MTVGAINKLIIMLYMNLMIMLFLLTPFTQKTYPWTLGARLSGTHEVYLSAHYYVSHKDTIVTVSFWKYNIN